MDKIFLSMITDGLKMSLPAPHNYLMKLYAENGYNVRVKIYEFNLSRNELVSMKVDFHELWYVVFNREDLYKFLGGGKGMKRLSKDLKIMIKKSVNPIYRRVCYLYNKFDPMMDCRV